MPRRSWLFTPADSARKLARVAGSGAGVVIVDLEDAVAEERKAVGRATAAEYLAGRATGGAGGGAGGSPAGGPAGGPEVFVRINGLATPHWRADLDALAGAAIDGIVLPKATPEGVATLDAELLLRGVAEDLAVMAIATETPAAVFALGGYAGLAVARPLAIGWGAEDLSAAVGARAVRAADGGWREPWRVVRTLTLLGAAAAGAPAVDSVFTDFRDLDGLRREALDARADGFSGKMAIHPGQVPVIEEVFRPTPAEIAAARAVVAAFEAAPGAGAVSLEGRMLDRPHLIQARRVLAEADPDGG